MTISSAHLSSEIEYPDTDGLPMAESDFQRQYLSYAVEVLRIYFKTMLMCVWESLHLLRTSNPSSGSTGCICSLWGS